MLVGEAEICTDVLLGGSTFQEKQKKKGMQDAREKWRKGANVIISHISEPLCL